MPLLCLQEPTGLGKTLLFDSQGQECRCYVSKSQQGWVKHCYLHCKLANHCKESGNRLGLVNLQLFVHGQGSGVHNAHISDFSDKLTV